MRILAMLLIGMFIMGCAHVPPGQIKKLTAPGQIKKVTGVNPMAAKKVDVDVKVKDSDVKVKVK